MKRPVSAHVYMMANKPRGVIYVGVSSDLQGRVWEHRNNIYPDCFTARYNCHRLVWFEYQPNIVIAIQREKTVKHYVRQWKINLIEGLNPTWVDLFDRIFEIKNHYEQPQRPKLRQPTATLARFS